MEVHLYDLEDEYIGSSDIEDPPPDFLERNGRSQRVLGLRMGAHVFPTAVLISESFFRQRNQVRR